MSGKKIKGFAQLFKGKALSIFGVDRMASEQKKRLLYLREYLLNSVEKNIKYTTINGDREKRLPGNANISFKFVQGEDL